MLLSTGTHQCLRIFHFLISSLENMVQQGRRCKGCGFDPWVRKFFWRRKWQPTPAFLPGKSHGQRSLVGYSLWVLKRVRHGLATKQQQQTRPALSATVPGTGRKTGNICWIHEQTAALLPLDRWGHKDQGRQVTDSSLPHTWRNHSSDEAQTPSPRLHPVSSASLLPSVPDTHSGPFFCSSQLLLSLLNTLAYG